MKKDASAPRTTPPPVAGTPAPWFFPWALALGFLGTALGCIQIADLSPLAKVREVQLEVKIVQADLLCLYLNNDRGMNHAFLFAAADFQPATFILPEDTVIQSLGFGPATRPGTVEIRSLTLNSLFRSRRLEAGELAACLEPSADISDCRIEQGVLKVVSRGRFPKLALKPGVTRAYFGPHAGAGLFKTFSRLLALAIAGFVFFLARLRTTADSGEIRARRQFVVGLLFSALLALASFLFFRETQFELFKPAAAVTLDFQAPQDDVAEVFWGSGLYQFGAQDRVTLPVRGKAGYQALTFSLPDRVLPLNLRIDPGQKPGALRIRSIKFQSFFGTVVSAGAALAGDFWPAAQIADYRLQDQSLAFTSTGNDPILTGSPALQARFAALAQRRTWFNRIVVATACLMLGVLFFFLFSRSRFFSDLSMPGKSYDLAVALGFLCLIFLPVANGALRFAHDLESTEKRTETAVPPLVPRNLFAWPRAFDAYFNEHFSFRNLLVRWNSILRVNLLQTSPNAGVVIGRQGWWYMRTDDERLGSISDHLGLRAFTPAEQARLRRKLEEESQWCREHGMLFFLLLCPYKSTIYPEYLPEGLEKPRGVGRLDQVIKLAQGIPNLRLIDLRPALLAAKRGHLLYYQKDLHWNEYGGFVGYQELFREVGSVFPGVTPFSPGDIRVTYQAAKQVGWTFDLVGMLNTSGVYGDVFCKVDILRTPPGLKKFPPTVVLHDSMFTAMQPFFAPACERFDHVNHQIKPFFNYHAFLAEKKPRLVIYEITENILPVLME